MLLQSLRALCLAPGGSGSVWKYLEALVRSPGVSGRIACGFQTELYFADVALGPGNPLGVQDMSGGSVRFGSRPGPIPETAFVLAGCYPSRT